MELSEVKLQQSDELVYHYTTVESFVSIMSGGELWASHESPSGRNDCRN